MSPNPPIGSGDRVQTRLIFTVFILWWHWKLGQGHKNLINSFKYPSNTIHKVWPESIIWSKRQSAHKLFWPKFDSQMTLVFLCNFGQNTPIGSGQAIDNAHFYSLYIVVTFKIRSKSPWKLGQGHHNLISSFYYPNGTTHKVWPESINWFKSYSAEKLFSGQNLTFKMLVSPWK